MTRVKGIKDLLQRIDNSELSVMNDFETRSARGIDSTGVLQDAAIELDGGITANIRSAFA